MVKKGEIFGLLGPNGAGKSTTIKVLTTLLKKTSGEATIDGMDLERNAKAIRRIIGYASQEIGVDNDLTARENLRLQCHYYHVPSGEIDDRVRSIIDTVGLTDAANRVSGTYSGGMRKRLDLATALVSRPKLLFLDEPTTGLDPQSRSAIWEYIKRLNDEGMSILLTTQYMEEADRLANDLCIVDHGKMVAEGSPSELKSQIGVSQIQMTFGGDRSDGRDRAIAALKGMEGVQEVKDCGEGLVCENEVIIYAKNGPALIPQIVRRLDENGVPIEQLTLSVPSLDDVFLKFTGRKLRVEDTRASGKRSPRTTRRRR